MNNIIVEAAHTCASVPEHGGLIIADADNACIIGCECNVAHVEGVSTKGKSDVIVVMAVAENDDAVVTGWCQQESYTKRVLLLL